MFFSIYILNIKYKQIYDWKIECTDNLLRLRSPGGEEKEKDEGHFSPGGEEKEKGEGHFLLRIFEG